MIESNIAQQEGESTIDYIARMVDLKDSLGITWTKLAEIINNRCGMDYSESYYRKGGWRTSTYEPVANESHGVEESFTKEELKLRDMLRKVRMEKVRLTDERTQNNAYIRQMSREESIKDIAHDFAVQMEKKPLLTPAVLPTEITPAYEYKEAILVISDWHYGIECDSYWNTYNPEIAVERINTLLNETLQRCKENNITKINVVNLSDLICGRIHLALRLESRIDVITQVMKVSEILAEFLSSLSDTMYVDYYDCEDNHSRIEPNKNDSIGLETLTRITHWYLAERLSQNKKITINENQYGDDIIAFDCMKYRVLGVHGDKDKPKSVVDRLSLMTKERPDLILVAHYHHFNADELNEIMVLGNGSLMGTDTYAKDKRLTSAPSQNLIIVSDKSVVDTLYRIVL